jgi:CRISPR-associated protein Csy2
MQQYILIKKLSVQNANAISGLTYGFPAITNFLGFAHAISRKLPDDLNIRLGGVAVISHKNNVHARQPKGWGDYVFALTRNPVTYQGKTAPINEEGRMNMQVSLLIEVDGITADAQYNSQLLLEQLHLLIPSMRLAGGQITAIENIEILKSEAQQKMSLRALMPGFVLLDRSDYLAQHFTSLLNDNAQASLFDAWCDFAKVAYQASKTSTDFVDVKLNNIAEPLKVKATWAYKKKPNPGFLVPISMGYYAISPLYPGGEVTNVRDTSVPVVFAETAYSVGEWQSVRRLNDINAAVWRYTNQYPWYIAKAETLKASSSHKDTIIEPDTLASDNNSVFDPNFL